MINVSLNNAPAELPDKTLLSEALKQWDYGEQKLAVAVNGAFVPRSRYGEITLQEGDHLDIVKPVGGG